MSDIETMYYTLAIISSVLFCAWLYLAITLLKLSWRMEDMEYRLTILAQARHKDAAPSSPLSQGS